MRKGFLTVGAVCAAFAATAVDYRPETWFHIIGGNASKEGLAADIAAIADAGLGGIQFFHGGFPGEEKVMWPGVKELIPCLSPKWTDLVKFASDECHKRGLTFKMQNCPGWSMSGGPWITIDNTMRRLVAHEPGKKPDYIADDDYRELFTVTFPVAGEAEGAVTTVTFPSPSKINHAWTYDPGVELVLFIDGQEVFRRACPQGSWDDIPEMTFNLDRPAPVTEKSVVRGEVQGRGGAREVKVTTGRELGRIDNWETKAARSLRSFTMRTDATPLAARGEKTLVIGHVNGRRVNFPAPKEGTGWECDKMSTRGIRANWDGYLGMLLKKGVKIDGALLDSWECSCQTWTENMEEEFRTRAGYALRPWIPALFGYVVKSEAETERFLLDWRNVCSRLVEENYYGEMARLARANGMTIQYETSFGDVIVGDILRYWKEADEPMCEFWHPHDNAKGFVGSYDFKAVLPCVSAAHVYGKKRVSAESLTSFDLTFDENFTEWKRTIDAHLGRGLTHVVFHTYTHNPVIGGKPPSASFGGGIGSPFLRGQTWWPYMKEFTAYLAFCGRELERGVPAVDILMYLGDDVNHKPSERELLFGNRYKYDYLNNDALMTRVDVKDGRLVFPDGFSCRVIWIPTGTFLLPETEKRLAELAGKGARIVRGDFTPDWPSPIEQLGFGTPGQHVLHWYQRRDGNTEIFFVALKDGSSRFAYREKDEQGNTRLSRVVNPVTRKTEKVDCLRGCLTSQEIELKPLADYPAWATKRTYVGQWTCDQKSAFHTELNLGKVKDWATVFVNGQEAARLWCEPYVCDVTDFLKEGVNEIKVEVTSTWYNAIVHDAELPEAERTTWTRREPPKNATYHDAGLYGPVTIGETCEKQ